MENILNSLKLPFIAINELLRYSNSLELGSETSSNNSSGDFIKKLDDLANTLIKDSLIENKNVRAIASEEDNDIIITKNTLGKYLVSFDPIDGSSNIDANITVGTIFCIFKYEKEKIKDGNNIVMSGYCLYGSSTQLIVASQNTVNMFILNKNNEFELFNKDHKMPIDGKQYSINHSNNNRWINIKIAEYTSTLISKGKTQRWVGSLVADAHRTIIKGGVFLYPIDSKQPNGKIRLIYEAYPMAYIFKCVGGYSSNEFQCILDIKFPTNIHEKTSLILFGKNEYGIFKNINIK